MKNDYSDEFKKIIEEIHEQERIKKQLEREEAVVNLKKFNKEQNNIELTKLIVTAIELDCDFIFNEISKNMESYQNFLIKNEDLENNMLLLEPIKTSNEDYFELLSSLTCFQKAVKTNDFLELACKNINSFIANQCLKVGLYNRDKLKEDIVKNKWSINHVSKLIVKNYMQEKKDLDFITLFKYDYYDINEIKDFNINQTLKLMQEFQQTQYFSRNNNPTEVFNEFVNHFSKNEKDLELAKNKIRFISSMINNLLNDQQYHNVGIIILNESLVTLGKNDKKFGVIALDALLEMMPDKYNLVMESISNIPSKNNWLIEHRTEKFKETLEKNLHKEIKKEEKKLKM